MWILKTPFLSQDTVGLVQNLLVRGSGPVRGTSPKLILHTTWYVFRNFEFLNLNSTGILFNIFCSTVINFRKLWSFSFKFNIEHRMLMTEIKWCSFDSWVCVFTVVITVAVVLWSSHYQLINIISKIRFKNNYQTTSNGPKTINNLPRHSLMIAI